MADKAREKGRTERYLPKAAWASMSADERKATDEKKKRATRGKPVNTHVANTEKAKRAGKKLAHTNEVSDMAKQGPCWDGYVQEGMKKKGGKMVPNCVRAKKKQSLSSFQEEVIRIGPPRSFCASDPSGSSSIKTAWYWLNSSPHASWISSICASSFSIVISVRNSAQSSRQYSRSFLIQGFFANPGKNLSKNKVAS